VELKPRIIEKHETAKPKILTENIMAKPRIFTETITAPIRQKIINQNTILNKRITAQPSYNRQAGRTINRDA